MKKGIYITLGVLFGLAVIASFMEEEPAVSEQGAPQTEVAQVEERQASEPSNNGEPEPAREWYEGGTLHNRSALEWQAAGYENKLATAADFVAGAYSNESFKPEVMRRINNMSDMRVLAEELVRQMDEATAPDPDKETNERMYGNQTVSSLAGMLMLMAGWIG